MLAVLIGHVEWIVKHKKLKSDGVGINGRIEAVKRLGKLFTDFIVDFTVCALSFIQKNKENFFKL